MKRLTTLAVGYIGLAVLANWLASEAVLNASQAESSAATALEYPTLREQLEAALHNIDCLNVDEDENALDYYRAERAKLLLREAIGGLPRV